MKCYRAASETTKPVQIDNIIELGWNTRTGTASAEWFVLKCSSRYHRFASGVATLRKTDKIIRMCNFK